MVKLLFVAILSIGIISGAAVSPEIWAIVEPHIIINMDPGQTTKPFVINDDVGTEVFSVDSDGSVNAGGFVVLSHTQSTELSVVFPNAESLSDATKIATWKITFDNTNVDFTGGTGNWGGANGVYTPEHCMSGYIKSSTGSLDVDVVLTQSPDNITYSGEPIGIANSGNTSYSAEDDCRESPIQNFLCADFNGITRTNGGADTFCYLSLAMFGDGAGTGFLKGFIFHQSLFLPDGATITKVLP